VTEKSKPGASNILTNNTGKSFPCDTVEPEYKKTVREIFRRQAFINFIGAEISCVLPGFCSLQLKYREELTRDPLCFHPGVIGSLAESAGLFAALTILPADSSIATTEYKLNLLAPPKGNVLAVHAKVVKSGKTMTVCTSEIYARRDRYQDLCGMALMTFVSE